MVGPAAVRLAAREFGSGPPVIILHGLLGSGRNWQSIAKQLARSRHVILPDLRNHGRSPWSTEMSYPAMAADLARLMDERAIEVASIVGHSMGGKAAMTLALLHADRVERLAAVDIAPVAYANAGFLLFIEAMRALPADTLARRADADAALAGAIADPAVRAFLLQNLSLAGERPGWEPNLAVLEEAMPALVGFPELAAAYDGPAMFIRGQRSSYVLDESLPAIRTLFPRFSLVTLPGAGHWVHADAPALVVEALEAHLQT